MEGELFNCLKIYGVLMYHLCQDLCGRSSRQQEFQIQLPWTMANYIVPILKAT